MPFRPAMPFVIRPRVYCNAAQRYFSAIRADGGFVTDARKIIINDLIIRIGTQGLWEKIDRLWLFAAENSQSALRDIKTASLATVSGSPTFQTDRGYTGASAGNAGYIDSNFNASTAGGNYTQDAAHVAGWTVNSIASAASSGAIVGVQSVATIAQLIPRFSDDKSYYRINDLAAGGSAGITNTDSRGFYIANRSGAAAQQGYRNAVDQSVVAVVSAALANSNFYILGVNNAGTKSLGDEHQDAMAGFGGSLTAGEVASYYSALSAYMTAVGVI